MRLGIQGLAEWRERLARLRADKLMASALAAEADRLAEAVRDGLGTAPGAGDHDRPWTRTGALRDSIAAQADGLSAAIGSNDPAAAPQELGTSRIPPRPFLAPVATAEAETVARTVADAVATALGSTRSITPPSGTGSGQA